MEKLAIKVCEFGVEHLCELGFLWLGFFWYLILKFLQILILSSGGENIGWTREWVPAIYGSVCFDCHGSMIWLTEKMKDGIQGARFGAGSAFGPFGLFLYGKDFNHHTLVLRVSWILYPLFPNDSFCVLWKLCLGKKNSLHYSLLHCSVKPTK